VEGSQEAIVDGVVVMAEPGGAGIMATVRLRQMEGVATALKVVADTDLRKEIEAGTAPLHVVTRVEQ